jgi:hypothetical protein
MLHQRPLRNETQFVEKNGDYDAENAIYEETPVQAIQTKNAYRFYISCYYYAFFAFTAICLIMGTYVEIFSKNTNLTAYQRQLQKKCDLDEMNHNITEHILCYAQNTKIMILTDVLHDSELMDKLEYTNLDMEFRFIHEIYEESIDIIHFLQIFDKKAPWIFFDGKYIGDFKDFQEYYDHNILQTGVENASIQPAFNQEEIRLLTSTDIDKKNMSFDKVKIRRNLRKYLPENTDDVWMDSQKKILEQQAKLLDELKHIEEMIEKKDEES